MPAKPPAISFFPFKHFHKRGAGHNWRVIVIKVDVISIEDAGYDCFQCSQVFPVSGVDAPVVAHILKTRELLRIVTPIKYVGAHLIEANADVGSADHVIRKRFRGDDENVPHGET